jgi:hypothetical protein
LNEVLPEDAIGFPHLVRTIGELAELAKILVLKREGDLE